MTRIHAWRVVATAIVLGGGVLTGNATAYIDPGTGSYVLQVAIAAAVAVAFSIKVFWKKIVAVLRRTFTSKRGGGPDAG